MTRYWKVLDENGRSTHGGDFQYSLPRWSETRGWIPGQWTPLITDMVPCERGYHVCQDAHLLEWLGPRIYACEIRGQIIDHGDKIVSGQVRLTCPTPWDEVSARLFAVECASDVLSLYESRCPNDPRVSDCLQTALAFAMGDATDAELAAARDAAGYAAGDAARAAAGAAAWAAARAAQTSRLLWWIGADAEA